ncbi:hypothetical protein B0H11DRAFT_2203556 [Mycena galericulata]|nr:hypothetical protein B0H11DRAFT_2203556 [Mycena galericulata]
MLVSCTIYIRLCQLELGLPVPGNPDLRVFPKHSELFLGGGKWSEDCLMNEQVGLKSTRVPNCGPAKGTRVHAEGRVPKLMIYPWGIHVLSSFPYKPLTLYHHALSHPALPIGAVPTEVLVKIFQSVWSSFPPFGKYPALPVETELDRLAHAPLLVLSQVCSQWHTVALGTPSLWCTLGLDSVLWSTPTNTQKTMTLLQSALERGGNCPLSISFICINAVLHIPALHLLASHAARWSKATFAGSSAMFQGMCQVKGQLPQLVWLDISIYNFKDVAHQDISSCLDMFTNLSSLKTFLFNGPIAAVPPLPLDQLSYLRFQYVTPEDTPPLFAFLQKLPGDAVGRLDLDLARASLQHVDMMHLDLPSLDLHLNNFTATFQNPFNVMHCRKVLHSIFTNVTFRTLRHLHFHAHDYPHSIIPWPQTDFISLCARSSFSHNLQTLNLESVAISESNLLDCLSEFSALEILLISDHRPRSPRAVDFHIINNSLFNKLTIKKEGSDFVPHLRCLSCRSFLHFNDRACLRLIHSRAGGRSGIPFQMTLEWLPGFYRSMPIIFGGIQSLQSSGMLMFKVTAA